VWNYGRHPICDGWE